MKRAAAGFGRVLALLVRGLTAVLPLRLRLVARAEAARAMTPEIVSSERTGALRLSGASAMAALRAAGFRGFEADTYRWLDAHVKPGETVWDIGANVGMFALYAARRCGARVFAFEPSAASYGVLCANVMRNGLGNGVTPLALALAEAPRVTQFHMKDAAAGGAMGALDRPDNVHGAFRAEAVQPVLALPADLAVSALGLPAPDHIKLDVDGGEAGVLAGGAQAFAQARTIWIELMPGEACAGANEALVARLAALGFTPDESASDPGSRNRLFMRR